MFFVLVSYEDGESEVADLSRVKDRDGLKPGREPHWNRIMAGCFLGYRPSARGGPGAWIARAYDEDARSYRFKALGDFAEMDGARKYAEAKKEAEAFAELVASGGRPKQNIETVADACRDYAKTATDAEGRFKRYVYDDPIGRVALAKLRRRHLQDWRARLEERPALVSRNKSGARRTRPRSPASVNRDMAVLRAALNRVLAPGPPNTEAAWQEALTAIRNADRQRTVYLDREQRKALLAAIGPEALPFVSALCLLPLRPGAMAGLSAGDFDRRTSELTIGKDKNGKPRRILLPADTAKLFAKAVKDKTPGAPLFMRANGKRWDRDTWKQPMARAVAAAKLPGGATAYTLRHATITDLVLGGLPLLTIAQISDTSVEMIERHYGHLNRDAAREALAALAL